jgi:hypothetical protein
MLVLLFTAAGTTILMAGKESRVKPERIPPAATATQPTLEPTPIIEPAAPAVEQPVAASTASGPIDRAPADEIGADADGIPPFPEVLPTGEASAHNTQLIREQLWGGSNISPDSPFAAAPDSLSWPLTGDGHTLPQVRISEPPTAMAHLPGFIVEPPSRQASNDDDKSSVY